MYNTMHEFFGLYVFSTELIKQHKFLGDIVLFQMVIDFGTKRIETIPHNS